LTARPSKDLQNLLDAPAMRVTGWVICRAETIGQSDLNANRKALNILEVQASLCIEFKANIIFLLSLFSMYE
jgi:hypothetical protein